MAAFGGAGDVIFCRLSALCIIVLQRFGFHLLPSSGTGRGDERQNKDNGFNGLQLDRVETGIVRVGEEVEIVGIKDTVKTTVTGVEMFRKLLDEGRAGENCGVLLRGTKREDVQRGQVLTKPGAIKPHTKFDAEVYVLSKEEGGRHTPFLNGYRPQFYFRTTDVTGAISLKDGVEMVMPGDNVEMSVELIHPIAMDAGLRFAIREGGRTVGAGVVAKVIA